MPHVTFVCTGNICRSPMAEKIFAAYARDAGLDVRVTSAGTESFHVGAPADPRAVDELAAHGYETAHVARQVDDEIRDADLVVALAAGHRAELSAQGVPDERLVLLRAFDPDAETTSVPDPYYGGDEGFALVREQIEAAVPALVERVASLDRA